VQSLVEVGGAGKRDSRRNVALTGASGSRRPGTKVQLQAVLVGKGAGLGLDGRRLAVEGKQCLANPRRMKTAPEDFAVSAEVGVWTSDDEFRLVIVVPCILDVAAPYLPASWGFSDGT